MDEVLKELKELKNMALLGAKQVLTMGEAALLTGLSRSHLYKLCCYKKIPHWKADGGGKYTYFDRSELNAWMLGNRIKTNDELETEAVTRIVTGKSKRRGAAV